MELTIVLQQMLVLFSMMSVGFALRRQGVLDQKGNGLLTRLILDVALPAAIITGVAGAPGERENAHLFYVIGLAFLLFFLFCLVAIPATWLMRPKREDFGALASVALFPNIAFMGFPLMMALYGPESMFYGVLVNLVFNVFALSIGVKLLAGSQAKMSLKLIFNIAMNASLVGIALFVLNITLPPVINIPMTHLGNMLTPLGMLLLGSILGGMDLKSVFSGWRIYAASFVKLLVVPVVVYLVLIQITDNVLMIGSMVIMSAVPTAPRTAMLAVRFGGNTELVSQGIFISTILSIAAFPLLFLLLGL